jgi:riboflavin biosynthesis pyrimidine reductase
MKPDFLSNLTISANFAISADGKISSLHHRPSGWTSKQDHQRLLDLRKSADAIFVGRKTLIADNMSLTVPDQAIQPLRCIASASGMLTGEENIFHRAGGDIHLWCQQAPSKKLANVILHDGSLVDFLTTLHERFHVTKLHCEGGGELMRSLLEIDCIDELHLTWAGHLLFGGKSAPTISGLPGEFFDRSRHFRLTHFEPIEGCDEVFLSYRRQPEQH